MWVKEKFLKDNKDKREFPSIKRLLKYKAKEKIMNALCEEFCKSFDEIKEERGIMRQIAMEIFYRLGGMKG